VAFPLMKLISRKYKIIVTQVHVNVPGELLMI